MLNKKTITWLLWAFLLLLFINFSLVAYYNWRFIEQSSVTTARVMAVVKNNIGYNTTVKFVTGHETLLQVDMVLLNEYLPGQFVPVRYNPIIPAQLRKDDFFGVWFSTLVTGGLILLISLFLYAMNVCRCWRHNKDKKLRQAGNHIYTKFDAVEAVIGIKKAGKHPYQIISSWHDKKTNKTYYYKSKYIWKNPVDYILDQTITVIIDNKSKKNYVMDLDFLPESIR